MKSKYFLIVCLLVLMGSGTASAVSSLYIDGIIQGSLRDISDNVTLSFGSDTQHWTLLAEYAAWRDKNNFGCYDESLNSSLIFSGPASPVLNATTHIAAGKEIGLWLLADHDYDGYADANEPYLFSERNWHATTGTDKSSYQFFHVYDVSAWKGTGAIYDFYTSNHDFRTTGDYDYLIYIDDSGAGPDYDHNDMIIGVSTVPEPASLLLVGLGLAGAGLARKRKK